MPGSRAGGVRRMTYAEYVRLATRRRARPPRPADDVQASKPTPQPEAPRTALSPGTRAAPLRPPRSRSPSPAGAERAAKRPRSEPDDALQPVSERPNAACPEAPASVTGGTIGQDEASVNEAGSSRPPTSTAGDSVICATGDVEKATEARAGPTVLSTDGVVGEADNPVQVEKAPEEARPTAPPASTTGNDEVSAIGDVEEAVEALAEPSVPPADDATGEAIKPVDVDEPPPKQISSEAPPASTSGDAEVNGAGEDDKLVEEHAVPSVPPTHRAVVEAERPAEFEEAPSKQVSPAPTPASTKQNAERNAMANVVEIPEPRVEPSMMLAKDASGEAEMPSDVEEAPRKKLNLEAVHGSSAGCCEVGAMGSVAKEGESCAGPALRPAAGSVSDARIAGRCDVFPGGTRDVADVLATAISQADALVREGEKRRRVVKEGPVKIVESATREDSDKAPSVVNCAAECPSGGTQLGVSRVAEAHVVGSAGEAAHPGVSNNPSPEAVHVASVSAPPSAIPTGALTNVISEAGVSLAATAHPSGVPGLAPGGSTVGAAAKSVDTTIAAAAKSVGPSAPEPSAASGDDGSLVSPLDSVRATGNEAVPPDAHDSIPFALGMSFSAVGDSSGVATTPLHANASLSLDVAVPTGSAISAPGSAGTAAEGVPTTASEALSSSRAVGASVPASSLLAASVTKGGSSAAGACTSSAMGDYGPAVTSADVALATPIIQAPLPVGEIQLASAGNVIDVSMQGEVDASGEAPSQPPGSADVVVVAGTASQIDPTSEASGGQDVRATNGNRRAASRRRSTRLKSISKSKAAASADAAVAGSSRAAASPKRKRGRPSKRSTEARGGKRSGTGSKRKYSKATEASKAERRARRMAVLNEQVDALDIDAILGRELDDYARNADFHARLARSRVRFEEERAMRNDDRLVRQRQIEEEQEAARVRSR